MIVESIIPMNLEKQILLNAISDFWSLNDMNVLANEPSEKLDSSISNLYWELYIPVMHEKYSTIFHIIVARNKIPMLFPTTLG